MRLLRETSLPFVFDTSSMGRRVRVRVGVGVGVRVRVRVRVRIVGVK